MRTENKEVSGKGDVYLPGVFASNHEPDPALPFGLPGSRLMHQLAMRCFVSVLRY